MGFYDNALALGVELTPDMLEKFAKYAEFLAVRNRDMNLVADASRETVETRHFLDSLALVPAIRSSGTGCGSLIDVGSGAGFPGLPAAIAMPETKVTLLDSLGKRCNFLSDAVRELGLENVEVINARAEEAARGSLRESFDAAASRAVAKLPMLCELCLPFVRKDGAFYAMKSRRALDELALAGNAIAKLGGGEHTVFDYTLPAFAEEESIELSLFVIRKRNITPDGYPRAFGAIKKRPL